MTPPRPRGRARSPTAGVTLVEVLVALVLFALIGGAGFGMLDQILRTQQRTEGRLEQLARLQRGMYLLTADFAQARSGTLAFDTGDRGPVLRVARSAAETGAGWIALTYRLEDGVLLREVADHAGRSVARQALLDGVGAVSWQFYDAEGGWVDAWPPARGDAGSAQAPANPAAVAAALSLADGQQLRRVAALPAEPR